MNTAQNVTPLNELEAKMAAANMPRQTSFKEWDAVAALNQCLAHAIELNSRIKQAHWAAKGESFYVFHKLSDDFTSKLGKQADRLSARIAAIGGVPAWTPAMIVKTSALPNYPADMDKAPQFLDALISSYKVASEPLPALISKAAKHNDYVTASVLTGFSKLLDQHQSFLASLSGITWLTKTKKQHMS